MFNIKKIERDIKVASKHFQQLVEQAKSVAKEYPDFDALGAAQSGSMWLTLSEKQQKLVAQAFVPYSVIGNAPDSGSGD